MTSPDDLSRVTSLASSSIPPNPYAVLNVPRDADARAIRSAYRSLARKFHPDKTNNSERHAEAFKIVGTAYATLSDPERRAAFDSFGSSSSSAFSSGPRSPNYVSPDDVLNAFFGRRRRRHGNPFSPSQRQQERQPDDRPWARLLPLLTVLLVSWLGSLSSPPSSSTSSSFIFSLSPDRPRFPVPRMTPPPRSVRYFVGVDADLSLDEDDRFRASMERAVERDYYVRMRRRCASERREKHRLASRAARVGDPSLRERAERFRTPNCDEATSPAWRE